MKQAYAPTEVPGGAALLTKTGEIVPGCNVENASYGLTLRGTYGGGLGRCARPSRLRCCGRHEHVATELPCGVCRQVLHEFAPDLTVRLVNPQGEQLTVSLGELLPMSFDKTELFRTEQGKSEPE